MGAVRNQNLPPEEQNFDDMGIHPRKGSIKDHRLVILVRNSFDIILFNI